MTASRLRIATVAIATALVAWLVPPAEAAQMHYWTEGSVDGTNTGPVTFVNHDPPFNPPGNFLLGHFQTSHIPDSTTLTFADTPIVIDIFFSTGEPGALVSEAEVHGVLNGTLTGDTVSTLVATFSSFSQVGTNPLPFPIDTLSMVGPLQVKPFAFGGGGKTHVEANSTFVPVPEPTALALFGTAFLGLGARRWRRARR